MLGNFSLNFFCRLLTFFKINFFKKFFQEHYKSVKQFETSVLIWVQTVCKGYQQTTLEDLKVLRRSPDLLNNVKIGQGQLQLIMEPICFTIYGDCRHFGQVTKTI